MVCVIVGLAVGIHAADFPGLMDEPWLIVAELMRPEPMVSMRVVASTT